MDRFSKIVWIIIICIFIWGFLVISTMGDDDKSVNGSEGETSISSGVVHGIIDSKNLSNMSSDELILEVVNESGLAVYLLT